MTTSAPPISIVARTPLGEPPPWAVLERRLFAVLDAAWREFEATYCAPDGSLVYRGTLRTRDGADDFYEPFFNWPTLYRLGGADELLAASKRHWEGVTAQLDRLGMLEAEYEVGYDWFHQAESLAFFYALCAADPDDPAFRERALRFARLYLPGSPTGNYDPATRTIVAPHTGAGGPRPGVGEEWEHYRADQHGMRPYGLPLHDVDGITGWDDLVTGDNAERMGSAMQERLGRGDTAVNLAATSLAANAWLYDGAPEFADWIAEYVDAWRDRAAANGGLLPDNVGPSGAVGELHGGAWYGGHYGWTWPHGLHALGAVTLVAATNRLLVGGDDSALDLARAPIDTVLRHASRTTANRFGTLAQHWEPRVPHGAEVQVVPYRRGPDGWFDEHPVPLLSPLWLWWLTGSPDDRGRLLGLRATAGYDWREVHRFRDKEEQGHEAPWIAYLLGDNPDYPRLGLELALAQVEERLRAMRATPHPPLDDDDIHWWQRLNPVVTEVLTHLVTGAPPAVYYGGLGLARVVLGDAERGRPGLPDDVAALVSSIRGGGLDLELLNLGEVPRTVVVHAGAFGEDRIDTAGTEHGDRLAVGGPRLEVVLPPATRVSLALDITRRAYRASHTSFARNKENR